MDTNEAPVTDTDRMAIVAAATDYIESWLDGDPDRMARCLHPELVKREVHYDGTFAVESMSHEEMSASPSRAQPRRSGTSSRWACRPHRRSCSPAGARGRPA
jgi:hypothetical protein